MEKRKKRFIVCPPLQGTIQKHMLVHPGYLSKLKISCAGPNACDVRDTRGNIVTHQCARENRLPRGDTSQGEAPSLPIFSALRFASHFFEIWRTFARVFRSSYYHRRQN